MKRVWFPTVSLLAKTGTMLCDCFLLWSHLYKQPMYLYSGAPHPGRPHASTQFLTPWSFLQGLTLHLPSCFVFFTDWHNVDPNLSPLNSHSSEGLLSKCKWYMNSLRLQTRSNYAEGEFPRFIGLFNSCKSFFNPRVHILIDLFLFKFMFLWIFL